MKGLKSSRPFPNQFIDWSKSSETSEKSRNAQNNHDDARLKFPIMKTWKLLI